MKINKKLSMQIIKYLIDNPIFYFPFYVAGKGIHGGDDYEEIIPSKENYLIINNSDKYNDFILVENLQNLNGDTIKLMSKGFIEKITQGNKFTYESK